MSKFFINVFNDFYFFNHLRNFFIVIFLSVCYHCLGVIHMDYNDYIDYSDDDHSYDVEDDDESYDLVIARCHVTVTYYIEIH